MLVRIPAGRMIAGVFDRLGNALALSRPQVVSAGGTVVVAPSPPARDRSHVVGVWSRAGLPGPVPCEIALTSEEGAIAPAIDVQTQERVIAVWYDVPSPANAHLRVACGDTQPFARSLHLTPGGVETVRAFLVKPPPVALPPA